MLTPRPLTTLLLLGIIAMAAANAPANTVNDAMVAQRLELMLDNGRTAMIRQVFRRFPSQTLPFIDSYLEGALAKLEAGETEGAVSSMFDRAVRFATIADEAFHETSFGEYANAFASWSPQERRRFREGQKLYKEGRQAAKDDPEKALILLRRSLRLAESLGDTWGQAMAHGAIGRLLMKTSPGDDAQFALVKAVELNSRIKLQEDFLRTLLDLAELRQTLKLPDMGAGYVRQAYTTALMDHTINPELMDRITQAHIEALEKGGRSDEAGKVRAEHARRLAEREAEPRPE